MRDPFMPLPPPSDEENMRMLCGSHGEVVYNTKLCAWHSNHGNSNFYGLRVGTPNRNKCRSKLDPAQQDITKQTHRSWPLLSLSFQG